MKKLIFGLFITLASTSACLAASGYPACDKYPIRPCTFVFENEQWLLASGGGNAPITNIRMTAGFGRFCPFHVIKTEPVSRNTGGRKYAMTRDQLFRGDPRGHVVCDRDFVPQPRGAAPNAAPYHRQSEEGSAVPHRNQAAPIPAFLTDEEEM